MSSSDRVDVDVVLADQQEQIEQLTATMTAQQEVLNKVLAELGDLQGSDVAELRRRERS